MSTKIFEISQKILDLLCKRVYNKIANCANAQKGAVAMYENLKIEMTKSGISQRTLSSVINVHENTVANKLNGDSTFSIEEAFAIKECLFPQCDLTYLFKKVNAI